MKRHQIFVESYLDANPIDSMNWKWRLQYEFFLFLHKHLRSIFGARHGSYIFQYLFANLAKYNSEIFCNAALIEESMAHLREISWEEWLAKRHDTALIINIEFVTKYQINKCPVKLEMCHVTPLIIFATKFILECYVSGWRQYFSVHSVDCVPDAALFQPESIC